MPERNDRAALLPVAATTRRDGVIAEIKRAIVLDSLKPGQKLTEARLSSELNVSRPTVQEALSRLAQEGLLVQEPYRGLRVASLDAAALLGIAETHMALDMQAVSAILADDPGHRLEMVLRGGTLKPARSTQIRSLPRGPPGVSPGYLGSIGKLPAAETVAGH